MVRILTSMIILLIITTFGYTDVEKQSKSSTNEAQIKELISFEQFNSLSEIPARQRESVFGLALQIVGITLKHSIDKEEGINFSVISYDEALKIIEKGEYYVEHREGFDTSLYFLFVESGCGHAMCLTGSNAEEMEARLKNNLISGRLSHIIEMKTVPKDNERIHSLKMYQIKYQ